MKSRFFIHYFTTSNNKNSRLIIYFHSMSTQGHDKYEFILQTDTTMCSQTESVICLKNNILSDKLNIINVLIRDRRKPFCHTETLSDSFLNTMVISLRISLKVLYLALLCQLQVKLSTCTTDAQTAFILHLNIVAFLFHSFCIALEF